jgi:hypothetical protein
MDAFEQLVAEILWREGYWVRNSVKVELTKEEKRAVGKPTSPRWELDVVAYSARDNLLNVVECKSWFDYRGVTLGMFDANNKMASRFKLFTDPNLRKVVFSRLRKQFADIGACRPNPKVRLCLACGHIASEKNRDGMRKLFKKERWELWDEVWLSDRLKEMAGGGYENHISAVVAKLLVDRP